MMISRQIRTVALFALLLIIPLLFGRTTQANTYENSLLDVLQADGRFDTYVGALQQTGLDQMLKFNGDFTVFAPTDSAFANLPPATRNAMFASTNTLKQTLLHHMLLSKWQTDVIGGWDVAHSLLGKQFQVRVESGSLIVDEARVINGNVIADNGLVHVINGVLIPPTGVFYTDPQANQTQQSSAPVSAESAVTATGTIHEILVADARFRTLLSAARSAGLTTMLDKNGPFTLFAPTNAAFDALPAGTVDALMADRTAVRQLILLHMAQGRFASDRLETLNVLRTALGENVTIEVRGGNLYIDSVRVVVENVQAENGIIHVVDALIQGGG